MDARKRKLTVVNMIINTLDLMEDDDEQQVSKRAKDRRWIRERDEKGAFSNIILDLSLDDLEGFRRYMRMNYN